MGTFTGLATIATFLTVLLVVGAVVVGASLIVLAVEWFATQRPIRLARRESITIYYLRGHAVAH
jgi:hypothetical protein